MRETLGARHAVPPLKRNNHQWEYPKGSYFHVIREETDSGGSVYTVARIVGVKPKSREDALIYEERRVFEGGDTLERIIQKFPVLRKTGFSQNPDGTFKVPADADRVNNGLLYDSEYVAHFYNTEGTVSRIEYLYSFAQEGRLPLATSGGIFFHDLNHLLGIIFLHPIVINMMRDHLQ